MRRRLHIMILNHTPLLYKIVPGFTQIEVSTAKLIIHRLGIHFGVTYGGTNFHWSTI